MGGETNETPGSVRTVVVDASQGGDLRFASEICSALNGAGVEAELREPPPSAMFDTGIHLVSAGISVRVTPPPDRGELEVIRGIVRDALLRHPSVRRRTRSVPVHLGETERIVAWLDAIE